MGPALVRLVLHLITVAAERLMATTHEHPPEPAVREDAAIEPARQSMGGFGAGRLLRVGRAHAPLLAVLGLYGASAFVVPTLAPAAVSDDFLYARSVEMLVADHRLVILPITAVTLVFQVAWGALFAALFGETFGVLRVATVVFTAASALAVYGLCRQLGVDKHRSALGTAIYLFNPLGYVLSFTFMTDSYFTGLVAISAYCYTRGLARVELHERWVLAGSVAAALAFLVRQQGILLPLGVLTYLVASRRLGRDRPSRRLVLQVMALPVLAALAYYAWYTFVYEAPVGTGEAGHLEAWSTASISDIVEQIIRTFFMEAMFIGVFTLPMGLAALWRLPALIASTSKRAWLVFAVIVALVLAATAFVPVLRLPLVPGFLNGAGLGPAWDLHGGRIPLVGSGARTVITVVCALAGLVVLLALCLRVLRSPIHAGAGVVLSMLLWQAAGVLAPSVRISYDRYLLPLLPLLVVLALWALRPVRVNLIAASLITVALAVFSVAGTHDFLTYQAATWQLARETHAAGVPYNTLDAGAAWTGYHLYEYSVKNKISVALPKDLPRGPILLSEHDVSGWWLTFYAPALRNGYTVSAEPLLSYTVVRRVEYSSWLEDEPTYIFLLRHRDAAPGGP
jgi:dolichyl-phosphate-mannose-protein mannosyltransferase